MRLMLFVGGVVLMHTCNLIFSFISHNYSIHRVRTTYHRSITEVGQPSTVGEQGQVYFPSTKFDQDGRGPAAV